FPFLLICLPGPLSSALFPYTTLFRSEDHGDRIADLDHRRTRAEARLNEIETRLSALDAELDAQRAAESRTQTQIVRAQGLTQRAEDKRSHLLSEVTSLGRRESKPPEEL